MRRMLEWEEWEVNVPTAPQPADSTRHCRKQEHFRVQGSALSAGGPLCKEGTYQGYISRDVSMYTPQGGMSLKGKGHTRHSAAAARSLVGKDTAQPNPPGILTIWDRPAPAHTVLGSRCIQALKLAVQEAEKARYLKIRFTKPNRKLCLQLLEVPRTGGDRGRQQVALFWIEKEQFSSQDDQLQPAASC